jgi:hypothetical protein
MEQFKDVVNEYINNYGSFKKGKICFDFDQGELIFLKKQNNMLILCSIYIFPLYRRQGLCQNILHYLIDKAQQEKIKYVCVIDVISKVLYNYLLRFSYQDKKFKNTKNGFIYKIK